MARELKVMAVASFPVEAAATRFRVQQFVRPLAKRGIMMTIHPFFDAEMFAQLYRRKSWPTTLLSLLKSSARRLADLARARQADVIFLQREAMTFGPPVIEWVMTRIANRPLVLDLDDATYVSYTSPTYGRLGRALKWFGKTDDLIRWAEVVICGNSSIAEYVSGKGARATIIPTIVDTNVFRPARPSGNRDEIVLGWIGTHSTYPYLETLFPVIRRLAESHNIRLRIVGAGSDNIELPGVKVDNLAWNLSREVADLQSFDIGLYPIDESYYPGWASGKSGFKAIQYMAVGLPYVATPVGGIIEIGTAGATCLFASDANEWHRALEELISDPERRRAMGAAGREHVTKYYELEDQAEKLVTILREVAGS